MIGVVCVVTYVILRWIYGEGTLRLSEGEKGVSESEESGFGQECVEFEFTGVGCFFF